ncbi:MAG TPA: hypothetical protein VNA15_09595 [Candidatus Angelobacter sp.]|nr:hypothetical protein [Candidatus Angelobacter sp.]
MPFLKINYLLLAPWIILSLPPLAIGQQQILVTSLVATFGLMGMMLGNRSVVLSVSASLLLLIVWGKIVADIYGLPGPDSALLLLQFMLVIFLMEASTTALAFDGKIKELRGRDDDLSALAIKRVGEWARVQLFSLGKLTTAAFGLSLGLVIFGSLVSVSVDQLAFSGFLVLASVVAIFILLTYRREPRELERSKV